ncbi:hypothetical protein KJY73_19270 [Bowmanella sp. Y26]|uniref:KfrA N-terminal DNA-binding domain-containing protein n=1 Tax=Bowmanella yangjiangensis TaxID=2811230 RepID=A0ABS3CXV3_9ALTE|nr:hypothetical protein [Bowmanella yangjiangensis]MBN7821415.1 hypothetical protein [Bowmanella yangjiangensis]MBT1065725.1 hypothetical protein [Bowmanella yangjiangensis]
MNNADYILSLCQELAAAGKAPSVALVKAKAQKPIPLADILSVLQKWKQAPAQMAAQALPSKATEVLVPSLEQRVDKLEKQLAELTSLVKQLNKHLLEK